jgi:hypothetical protein
MDFIAYHRQVFGENLVVVANMADHLNANEIRRISDRAPHRMELYGISPAPRFYALSARLELARGVRMNEYRNRTKRDVRDLCDAGFDALRVALYEFEAAHSGATVCPSFDSLLSAPLAASFVQKQEGVAS